MTYDIRINDSELNLEFSYCLYKNVKVYEVVLKYFFIILKII